MLSMESRKLSESGQDGLFSLFFLSRQIGEQILPLILPPHFAFLVS